MKFLVVGDICTDINIRLGARSDVAETIKTTPGMAGHVARQLAALSPTENIVSLIAPLTRDLDSVLRRCLIDDPGKPSIKTTSVVAEEDYQRVYIRHHDGRLIKRYDMNQPRISPVNPGLPALLDKFLAEDGERSAVLVADYGYGTVPPSMVSTFIAACSSKRSLLLVDSKTPQMWLKSAANSSWDSTNLHVQMNFDRALKLLANHGLPADSDMRPQELCREIGRLLKLVYQPQAGSVAVLLTLGPAGAARVCTDGTWVHQPADNVVGFVDPTGAGDVFLAAYAHALRNYSLPTSGPYTCLDYAIAVASESCRRLGTTPVSAHQAPEIKRGDALDFITTAGRLAAYRLGDVKCPIMTCQVPHDLRNGVVVPGVFDVLHAGHLHLIRYAKCGLVSETLSSPKREVVALIPTNALAPRLAKFNKETGRKHMVNSTEARVVTLLLAGVDCVVVQLDDHDPTKYIAASKAGVVLKGEEYRDLPIGDAATPGTTYAYCPRLDGFSTESLCTYTWQAREPAAS